VQKISREEKGEDTHIATEDNTQTVSQLLLQLQTACFKIHTKPKQN
jgi:hypothetical protein